MQLRRIARSVYPWAFTIVLFAGIPGCGGEAQTTGTVVREDPDAAVRTKEMEDYMAKQNAPKKKR